MIVVLILVLVLVVVLVVVVFLVQVEFLVQVVEEEYLVVQNLVEQKHVHAQYQLALYQVLVLLKQLVVW